MKSLPKIAALLLLGSITLGAYADDNDQPPINQVSLSLSTEKWAITDTARVIVNVNAGLKSDALNTFRDALLKNLAKLSNAGEWHITQFYRYQDQSGLERLQVSAEARLPNDVLSNLYDGAKAISKPGEQYTIGDIQFVPSLAEIEKTKNEARAQIYADANAELTRLNKEFPDSHFVIHSVNFSGMSVPEPMYARTAGAAPTALAVTDNGGGSGGSGVSVNDKITMMATVSFASLLK